MFFTNQVGAYPHGGLLERSPGLGRVLYVHNTLGRAGNSGTVDAPLATVVGAIAALSSASNTENRGDTILCLEGHSEAVDTATEFVLARAGVRIIGRGVGTRQPILQLATATTATLNITAANCEINNINIQTAIASCAAAVTVSASNLKIRNCTFSESGSGTMLIAVSAPSTTDNTNDGLEMTDCNIALASTATRQVILTAANIAKVKILRNFGVIGVNVGFSIFQAATGKSWQSIEMRENVIQRANTDIDTVKSLILSDTATNSGMVCDNRFGHLDTASTSGGIDITGAMLIDNKAIGVVDASGLLLPAVDDNV